MSASNKCALRSVIDDYAVVMKVAELAKVSGCFYGLKIMAGTGSHNSLTCSFCLG